MNITLISPYDDIQAFGLRTISSCLKRDGNSVRVVFLPRDCLLRYKEETLDELIELGKESDVIGISLMTNHFDNAVQLTEKLRELDVPIVWGGSHPTIRPNECLKYADIICMGESDESFAELVRVMENKGDIHDVKGIWLKEGSQIIKNEIRHLCTDLDSIPYPDYDYKSQYTLSEGHIQKFNEQIFKIQTGGRYWTLTTRGCPFSCTYCCNNAINQMYDYKNIFRKRNIDHVIGELELVKENLPIDTIVLQDDAFFLRDDIAEFSKKYKERVNLPLRVVGASPATLTREKLEPLIDAGLIYVRMGIQTGSERTKKLFNRNYPNKKVLEGARLLNEFKDKLELPNYDIILDTPWETEEDVIDTLMFLSEMPMPYMLGLFSLTFYPGTELYNKAREDGIITDDLNQIYRKKYHRFNKTYLNKLFILLNGSAQIGAQISPKMMAFLIKKRSNLLYYLLRLRTLPLKFKQKDRIRYGKVQHGKND